MRQRENATGIAKVGENIIKSSHGSQISSMSAVISSETDTLQPGGCPESREKRSGIALLANFFKYSNHSCCSRSNVCRMLASLIMAGL